jgi:FAD/FMN-containing dehydrogenase/NAD-dependent dihydropyrimidine dehydrogenase PreA subunit
MKLDRFLLEKSFSSTSRIITEPTHLRMFSFDQGEVPEPMRSLLIPNTLPDLAVQPRSVQDLQATIRFGLQRGVPIVPRGASTFGLGGAIPHHGGILLDFSTYREIINFNPESETIRVTAGCRWADVSRFLEPLGFALCTYPTSWFSTVGGWAATGGIGIGCTKYGSFHLLIRELTVVTPQGEIKTLAPQDPDFKFFLGTEGQMGAIWDVSFVVRRRPKVQLPFVLHFDSVSAALDCATELLQEFDPYHLKFLSAARMHEINHLAKEEHPGLKNDLLHAEKDSLLVCFDEEAGTEASPPGVQHFREWTQKKSITMESDYRAHWLWRDRMFPLRVKRLAPGLLASEVVLPQKTATQFVDRANQLGRRFHVNLACEGYLIKGGNILMLPVYTFHSSGKIDAALKSSLSYALTRLGIQIGGRPYGTGLWNTPFVKSRFNGAFSDLQNYKHSKDSANSFNPGKFFNLDFRTGFAGKLASVIFSSPMMSLAGIATPTLATLLTRNAHQERNKDLVLLNEELCSKCGSCIPVCPAYIETGDERTTARGKLQLGLAMMKNQELSADAAQMLFLCMHCGACTDVCQSRLDLVPVWDDLERRVEQRFGKPKEKVNEFFESVESKKIMEIPYARGYKVATRS